MDKVTQAATQAATEGAKEQVTNKINSNGDIKWYLPWTWFRKPPISTEKWTDKTYNDYKVAGWMRNFNISFYTVILLVFNGWVEYGLTESVMQVTQQGFATTGAYVGLGAGMLFTPLITHGIQGIVVKRTQPKFNTKIDIHHLKTSVGGLILTAIPVITLIVSIIIYFAAKHHWKKTHLVWCEDCLNNPQIINPKKAYELKLTLEGLQEHKKTEISAMLERKRQKLDKKLTKRYTTKPQVEQTEASLELE